MVDGELIHRFRNKVNEHDFVLFKYRNVNGKDHWSCICSAMDWITVAIEHIAEVRNSKKNLQQGMKMYAYISSIDVIWEAVQQIHRVLFDTDKIPFRNERNCFTNKILLQNDNIYFKTIRACFGAHSVNLKLKDKHGERKYFASWPGTSLNGDYDVLLYSNIVDKEYLTMVLKIDELNGFFDKRYNYLNQLMNEIDRQYKEFISEMKNKPIEKADNAYDQLLILKDESSKRLNLTFYKVLIDELIMMFNIQITNKTNEKMMDAYRKALLPLIKQIYNSLQGMKFKGVDDSILYQTTNKLPNGYGYWMEKIANYIHGAGYHPMMWEDRLTQIFKDHMIMEYSTPEEFYVLIHACIYKLNQDVE